ncbi:hypothetical protein ABHI18_001867 [Aspergillus niger]
MTLPCPNWLREVLLGLEITVFLPQIWRIWSQKTSTGLSLLYIFFNLLSATERFTNAFFGTVNWTIAGANAPGFFVHDPRTIGDWLNLVQLGVDWVLLLLLLRLVPFSTVRAPPTRTLTENGPSFILCLTNPPPHYRSQAHTRILSAILYTTFALISIIPLFIDALFPSIFHEPGERQPDFGVAIFAGFHLFFLNTIFTLLSICSIIPQAIQLRSLSLASGVVRDIEEAGAIGAGGMELLGLYNYGGSLAPQPAGADWATYGFGTPAFNAIFKASLQSAKSTGMIFDFALGPSQGQGVPANPNDEGLHWDLAPFNVSVPPNGTYNGQIPGWGTGELVSLVSARVMNTSTVVNPASSLFSTPANNATRLVLAAGSLVDHTDAVSVDGKVSLSFNVSEHSTYRLFAYYQYQDLVKNLDIHESSTGSIFDNGSYTENYILNDTDIKSLFQEVGRYGWEDSIEIKSNISWSPSLPGIFEQINGYQLGKYLPLVMYGNNNPGVQPSYPGNLECVLDREDQGQGYVNDFRAALEKGYQVYLDTLSAWLEGLGLGYSAQVSYNLPINMEVNINHVIAPECESLAFNNNIDGYRQFPGVANLANLAQKNVIPNEMGANLEKAFALPVSELLGQINTAFAGGVNQIVLHGQSYTGDYHKTTWPGYIFFFMLFAESYYNKQPAWGYGFSDVINYISRN